MASSRASQYFFHRRCGVITSAGDRSLSFVLFAPQSQPLSQFVSICVGWDYSVVCCFAGSCCRQALCCPRRLHLHSPWVLRGVLCALISTGSCRAFRSAEMSSQWERCLQHSVNITISHFKRCHCMSSFHFLIGDRSVHESLWCKVSSSYRTAAHMLQARNNGYLYGSLRRKDGVFLMSSGNDSLYIMFPPHR